MPIVHAIADYCPMPCTTEVVLVSRVRDRRVFAWCVSCGVAWAEPGKETWQLGDLGQAELHLGLLTGFESVEFATGADIEIAGLAKLVVKRWEADDWWLERLAEFNTFWAGPVEAHRRQWRAPPSP